jgi:predicted aspartyl protease
MRKVYANIQIFNANDIAFMRSGLLEESSITLVEEKCVVDYNIKMLCINKDIQQKLQLPVIEKKAFRMNDTTLKEFEIVSDVIVKFKNRQTCCSAIVLPSNKEVLLGMIPLNGLDVRINNHELITNSKHPMTKLPSIFKRKEN